MNKLCSQQQRKNAFLALLFLCTHPIPSFAFFKGISRHRSNKNKLHTADHLSDFDHDPSVLYNFYHNRPIQPNVREALQDLELHASDEYIKQILDQVLDPSLYSSNIILQYKPHRGWLWRQWHGTILPHSLTKIFINMALATAVCWIFSKHGICSQREQNAAAWWHLTPSENCIWVASLKAFDKLWHYQMQLTTFILTFFVGQAYSFWREIYATGRKIQGRLNDIGILVATHVRRNSDDGMLGEEATEFLQAVARHVRLFTVLFWASQSRQFKVLLTRRGMERMEQAGIMTPNELQILLKIPSPPTYRHAAVLEWIIIECLQARREGVLPDSSELFKLLLEKCSELRGTSTGVGDLVAGRMPLAYTHFVQVLVDSFLFAAPLALFAELGNLNILCVGMMTLFYEGLLDLAKVLLDPLNNEDFCEGGINMDLGVLVRETNAGSLRWMIGATVLPFETKDLASSRTTAQ